MYGSCGISELLGQAGLFEDRIGRMSGLDLLIALAMSFEATPGFRQKPLEFRRQVAAH